MDAGQVGRMFPRNTTNACITSETEGLTNACQMLRPELSTR